MSISCYDQPQPSARYVLEIAALSINRPLCGNMKMTLTFDSINEKSSGCHGQMAVKYDMKEVSYYLTFYYRMATRIAPIISIDDMSEAMLIIFYKLTAWRTAHFTL